MATPATAPRTDTVPHRAPHGRAEAGRVSLPRGWRHSALVAWLRDQPQEQRETVMAGLFGFLAAIWAPIGILAFLANVFTIFLVVSALVAVAVTAPRPTAVAALTAVVRERVLPELRVAWGELATASRHVRRELPGVVAQLHDEVSPALRAAGNRTGAAVSGVWASIRRGIAHTRGRLAELGPRPAQSTPRSAR